MTGSDAGRSLGKLWEAITRSHLERIGEGAQVNGHVRRHEWGEQSRWKTGAWFVGLKEAKGAALDGQEIGWADNSDDIKNIYTILKGHESEVPSHTISSIV